MNWKLKALMQNIIALLPTKISYSVHYQVQRHFGSWRRVNANTMSKLMSGLEICERILKYGHTPKDKVFFEVGSGRTPIIPLVYWLMGAKKTITIDINPYMKEELLREFLEFISINGLEVERLFNNLIDHGRWRALLDFSRKGDCSLKDFLELCQILYLAPGDAAKTDLPEESVDFHTSYVVFELVPPNVLKDILKEGNRIVKKEGLFIHAIDYTDHFRYADKKITPINFLQYSDKMWKLYAGNRYMYMNRFLN
jgi:SAM-dependent methyltransferase